MSGNLKYVMRDFTYGILSGTENIYFYEIFIYIFMTSENNNLFFSQLIMIFLKFSSDFIYLQK
jgi:hypothetical protein